MTTIRVRAANALASLKARARRRPPAAQCPNRAQVHGPASECLVAVLLGVLSDRHDAPLSQRQIDHIMGQLDADALWEAFGAPAVDVLELMLPAS